jgi:uncharacterized OsmC-like protein
MTEGIAGRLESLEVFYADQPERAVATDAPATAVLGDDLRCEVTGPNGWSLQTAMMRGVGGDATGPTPGWVMRSAVASCTATTIAMRAARAGIQIEGVEVLAESTSDGRGLLGLDGHPPQPIEMRLTVTVSAPGADPAQIERLVHEADLSSPMGESLRNPISITTNVVHATPAD